MKLKLYKIVFNFLSFLTDKTEGKASVLVKYKLILGSIIVALTNTSCNTNQGQNVTCYYPINEDKDSIGEIIESVDIIEEPTCYVVIRFDDNLGIVDDSIPTKNTKEGLIEPKDENTAI